MCVHMCMYAMRICAYEYVYVCVCVYVHMSMCMCVCLYVLKEFLDTMPVHQFQSGTGFVTPLGHFLAVAPLAHF